MVRNMWAHQDARFQATTLAGQSGTRYNLTVEMLPGGKWDWVVWPAGAMTKIVRTGVAITADRAAAHAENAVGDLEYHGEVSI